jgi:hypothetical protein
MERNSKMGHIFVHRRTYKIGSPYNIEVFLWNTSPFYVGELCATLREELRIFKDKANLICEDGNNFEISLELAHKWARWRGFTP